MSQKGRPCKRCGSKSTVQMDGKLFCSGCSEQIEEYIEYGEDEEAGMMNVTISQRLTTPAALFGFGDMDDEEQEVRERTPVLEALPQTSQSQKKSGTKRKPRNIEDEKLPPGYLDILEDTVRHPKDRNIGIAAMKVGSISKILWKVSCMMKVELRFPEIYSKQVHAILQMYLKKCGIAFTAEEYTEDLEKMHRKSHVIKRSKRTVTENLRKLEIEKKKKGIKKLEQSQDVWDILQSTQMSEHFELSSEDEELNQTRYEEALSDTEIVVVDTKVNKEHRKMAEDVYFNFDIIVGILHLAAVISGCHWVTISDIVRWLREDRARIFGEMGKFSEHLAGGGWENFMAIFCSMRVPLYEYYRTSIWIWQLIDIDTSSLSLNFPQLVSRALHNLNLPTKILGKIVYLLNCAPPSEVLDKTFLTQQGDIKDSILSPDKLIKSDEMIKCFGRPGREETTFRKTDVFISNETKVLAYVLLALKLTFGLDDKREYSFRDGTFDLVEWIYQLKMRIMIWEGHDVKDVLNVRKINYPLSTRSTVIDNAIGLMNQKKFYLRQDARISQIDTCIPTVTPCESAYELPNPLISSITDRSIDRNDADRIYAPIRGQKRIIRHYMSQKRTEEEQRTLNCEIDEEAYQIINKDYSDCKIRVIKDDVKNKEAFGTKRQTEERFLDDKDADNWHAMFPCAKDYIKYPSPLWSQGSFICRHENHEKGTDLRAPYISFRVASDLYSVASKTFSSNFEDILELFCKSIGEHKHILYAAFTMLETQIIDRRMYRKLCKALIDNDPAQIKILSRSRYSLETFELLADIYVTGEIKEARELRWLIFNLPNVNDKNDSNAVESETEEASEDQEDSSGGEAIPKFRTIKAKRRKKKAKSNNMVHISKYLYDWQTYWHLVTMRYW